eukprot:Stramenopile-MAST_4_protein_5598
MKFTPAFVAAFVAMTWSQEAEGFGDKLQVRPTFPNPMRPNRNMFDDNLGGGSFFVEGGVNGGGQNGNPKWDGKVRFERTWDDQDEDQLGYPDYFKSQTPNYLSVRDQDDDLGGGSFFVEGGVNGGGQNGNPKWDGKIRYERTLDDQDEDQLGYPDYFKSQTPNYLSVRDQDDDLGGKNKISVSGGVSGGGNGRPEWNGRIGFENEWDNDA